MSSNRHNNQLPTNLAQLQNVIKRDPESYKEEFLQQFRHFTSTLEVFELSPDKFNSSLDDLVMFLAQVAKCYGAEMKEFPDMIVRALRKHSTVIDPDMRLSFCRALILLRNKSLISPAEIHQLFFELLSCQDKTLRSFLKDNIINDIKNINAKHKDIKLNTTLQNFMYSMLRDNHAIAVKTSLEIMITLYQKNVWRDQKTVNVITTACFHKVTKVMVAALKFFLGTDTAEDEESDDDDGPTVKEETMANKVNKKTKKRAKMLENIKKAHKKKVNKEKVPSFNFSALHLLHDPQSLCERLFKKLESLKEKFEVKLLMVELVSRLIGVHELQVLSFYPYISRFLVPHQREVVKMLQYCAQSAHELIPPDAIEPVLKAIVNNFVTERNSAEVMAVGLNAIREICARCPLVMDEDLLHDLAEYKSYKNKAVMMASKSLILLFRQTHPELLHKKDRGRPTEAMVVQERRGFGEAEIFDHIPGAEVLDAEEETPEPKVEEPRGKKRKLDKDEVESESDDDMDYDDIGDEVEQTDHLSLEEKLAKAKEVTVGRILTDEDFRKIDAAQLRKQVMGVRKHKRQKVVESTDIDETGGRKELVDLKDIEMIHGAKKAGKEERVAAIKAGREGRGKFGGGRQKMDEFASTTNKQKGKKKNFSMMKHKIKKSKTKRSFREKQMDLQKRLIKQQKFSGK